MRSSAKKTIQVQTGTVRKNQFELEFQKVSLAFLFTKNEGRIFPKGRHSASPQNLRQKRPNVFGQIQLEMM